LISEQEHIQYKGVLDFRTAIQTLNGYDCLLFPTYFIGEGFPGTIFEGFAAGLPIIATDWLFNRELICDGENGFLVPIRNPAAIAEKLALLAENDELVYKMSLQSLASFDKYREERAVPPLYEALDAILKKSNYDA
jgi:glycosyltransferase involved in cell wall biosynthesis